MITTDFPSLSSGTRSAVVVRPSTVRRLASLAGTLLMIVAILAVLLLAVGPRFLGYQTATMLTGSMAPGIMPGDVVVTTEQPVGEVAVGDVISYRIPVEDHRVETHRVTEVIHDAAGTTSVRTKGDANAAVDPWTATLEGDDVYQVAAVVPEVGKVIRALRTPAVSQVLVYGVPAVLVGALLLMIWSRSEEDDDDGPAVPGSSASLESSPATVSPADGAGPADLPVLDRQALDDLDPDPVNPAAALVFAATFVEMIPQRVDAIGAAVAARDADAAVVALLSLNVSASMVGARRLEEVSSAGLELIDELPALGALIPRMRQHGAEFAAALGGIAHRDMQPH